MCIGRGDLLGVYLFCDTGVVGGVLVFSDSELLSSVCSIEMLSDPGGLLACISNLTLFIGFLAHLDLWMLRTAPLRDFTDTGTVSLPSNDISLSSHKIHTHQGVYQLFTLIISIVSYLLIVQ